MFRKHVGVRGFFVAGYVPREADGLRFLPTGEIGVAMARPEMVVLLLLWVAGSTRPRAHLVYGKELPTCVELQSDCGGLFTTQASVSRQCIHLCSWHPATILTCKLCGIRLAGPL